MAEEAINEVRESITETERELSTQDMEVEAQTPASGETEGDAAANGVKHEREDGDEAEKDENGGDKKQKVVEKSVEEQRFEGSVKTEAVDGENSTGMQGPVSVGCKSFGTSVEMFDYFFKFLHSWSPNININKYEHMMLLDLLQKGHQEPERKIGNGIQAFQIRYHPQYKSRCFFLIRNDESVDDFSFRKCVDNICPLPENMQIKSDVIKTFGGHNGGGRGGRGGWRGRGRGHGRGRGGKPRN